MPAECIQPLVPQRPVRLEPGVELRERRRVAVVEAPLRVAANANQPVLAKDPEVLRDARLAQPRPLDDLPDRPRAVTQQVEDLAPARFRDGGECVCHSGYITTSATLRKGSDPWLRVRKRRGAPSGEDAPLTSGRWSRCVSRRESPSARGP